MLELNHDNALNAKEYLAPNQISLVDLRRAP